MAAADIDRNLLFGVIALQDDIIDEGDDAGAVLVVFLALLLTLRAFDPAALPDVFPLAASRRDRIAALVVEDVDVPALLAETRLAGSLGLEGGEDEDARAPDPGAGGIMRGAGPTVPPPAQLRGRFQRAYARLMARKARAIARGNLVRAAICQYRAAGLLPVLNRPAARLEAVHLVERLVDRLAAPLALEQADLSTWRRTLPAVLEGAAHRAWPAAAAVPPGGPAGPSSPRGP